MTDEQSTAGKLSAEDQVEFDRLEALEKDEVAEQRAQDNRADGLLTGDERRDLRARGEKSAEPGESDPKAEADYPVENAALNWSDASNGGDTSRQAKSTYDTPWGRRELTHEEVVDLEHQGHVLTRVDDEPQTSLEREKADMARIPLTAGSDDH